MTALTQYQRLESPGVWHQSPDSQRRDVYVSLGEATLVIKDQADVALTHWSLPAIVRLGPGNDPAIFAPGPQDEERLELTDTTMIEALEQVQRAIARTKPHKGRLRFGILLAVLLAIGALATFWLPGALVTQTARAMPEATRQEIGRRLVLSLEPYVGRPCRDISGRNALNMLQSRLFGDAPWELRVVENGSRVIALPGGLLVIGGDLLSEYDTADTVAGHLLAAATRSAQRNPMGQFLEQAGTRETLRMLTTGQVTAPVLARTAATLALEPVASGLTPAPTLRRFEQAGVSSRAFGLTAGPDGDPWLEMIEDDPFPGGTPAPLIPDAAWLRLQAICD